MRHTLLYISALIVLCVAFSSCQWSGWTAPDSDAPDGIKVERYDRLQNRYLTTGDFSALQSMNTNYPMETRTLIEDVLQLGTVDQQDINERLLHFFQDSTLQTVLSDVQAQYANMDDINNELTVAFRRLTKRMPDVKIPEFYSLIGAFSQSIIISDGSVGICLDKYLGTDYEVYREYYYDQQIQTMKRQQIVPDCVFFYLLSLYPLEHIGNQTQESRDAHIGKIMYIVNTILDEQAFSTPHVKLTEAYMKKHPRMALEKLLTTDAS